MRSGSAKGTLLGLSLLFLLPLVLAWLMYSGVIDYKPAATRNHGTLVNPPVKAGLPEAFQRKGLAGHWLLLYPVAPACGEVCRADLLGLIQVRKALGREADRTRTVVVTGAKPEDEAWQNIPDIESETSVISDSSGMLRGQLNNIEGGAGTFLIDPMGNIMMHYRAGADPNDIRLDLKRLLKYAKTDSQN